jgi:hypothetical protein
MKKSLVLLVAAWVLTINGNSVVLNWLIELLRVLGVNAETFGGLPFVMVGLQILLYGLAILFGFLSKEQASLKPLSLIVIAVNCVSVLNAVAATVYAVASGQLG